MTTVNYVISVEIFMLTDITDSYYNENACICETLKSEKKTVFNTRVKVKV